MIYLFLILFKVIPPERFHKISSLVKKVKIFGCGDNENRIFNGDDFAGQLDIDTFFLCDSNTPVLNIINCEYKNIMAKQFGKWAWDKHYNPKYMIQIGNINSYLYNNIISNCATTHYLIYVTNSDPNNYFYMSTNKLIKCDSGSNFKELNLLFLNNINVEIFNNTFSECYVHEGYIRINSEYENAYFKMLSNNIDHGDHNRNQKASYIVNVKNANTYIHDNNISICKTTNSIIEFRSDKTNIYRFEMYSNIITDCTNNKDVPGKYIFFAENANTSFHDNSISKCKVFGPLIYYKSTQNNNYYFEMFSNDITNCIHDSGVKATHIIAVYNSNTYIHENSISECTVGNCIIEVSCDNGNSYNSELFLNTITNCLHDSSVKANHIVAVYNLNTYIHENSISECTVGNCIIEVSNGHSNIYNLEMSLNNITKCIHDSNVDARLLMYISKVEAFLHNNIISDCTHYQSSYSFIEANCQEQNCVFKFYSNVITNCYCNQKKSKTINTNYFNNDFRDNVIKYENDPNKASRAFYIEYNSGLQLINTIVENAFQTDGSAFILSKNHNKENPSIIKNCVFINCKGDNASKNGGLALIVENLDYNLEFINVTFKDIDTTSVTTETKSTFLIRIQTNFDLSPTVTFTNCHFIGLQNRPECYAGGISFVYHHDKKKEKTVYFVNSTFEQITNNNPNAGGAIYIDPRDVLQNVNLVVKGCTFHDIKSAGSGGGICYNDISKQLIVEDCTFNQVQTTGENKIGGAIYVAEQNSYQLISITGSIFENTNSNEGGAIYITCAESSNTEIKIDGCNFLNTHASSKGHSIIILKTNDNKVPVTNCIFTDCGDNRITYAVILNVKNLECNNNAFSFSNIEKNSGCIHLEQIGTHEFIGNTFSNAQVNDDIGRSSGINYEKEVDITSLLIQNNTFDNIGGQHKGSCFSFTVQNSEVIRIINNTIQNCKSGSPFFRVSFTSDQTKFEIESMRFISDSIGTTYDSTMGSTPQFIVENPLNQGSNYPAELELLLSDCYFYENYNPNAGGALSYATSNSISNTKLHLENCQFIGNTGGQGDGALCIRCYHGLICEDCNFTRNKSNGGNGIISIETKFNSRKDGQDLPPVLATNPEINFLRCNFEKEETTANEIFISSSESATVQIQQCTFTDSINKGYIAYIDEDKIEKVSIANCSFLFSDSENSAAAVLSSRDKIEFIGNTFQKCNSKTIQIECQTLETNSFILRENLFIDCFKHPIIYLQTPITNAPVIEGNTFDNAAFIDGLIFEFKLKESVSSITFKNNTFKNFNIKSQAGGIGFKIENEETSKDLHLSFDECYFTSNKQEGAIYCDSNQNKGNTFLTITDCHFHDNQHAEKGGGAIYANTKHDIIIEKCKFTSNSAEKGASICVDPDFEGETTGSKITISDCNFNQNTPLKEGNSSVYISSSSNKNLLFELCTFEDENGGLYIDNFNQDITITTTTFYNVNNGPALYLTETSTTININVDGLVFDSCKGNENKCFYFLTETNNIDIHNWVLQNLVGTGVNSYFGTFDVKDQRSYTLKNVSFINNICDSLYGGGAGIRFIEFGSLNIIECKFINNSAKQNKEASRPSSNEKNYYNGDGGAIQIGYHCKMYDMDVVFSECIFKDNRAQRHGGAIAAQTYHGLSIDQCFFENNIANYDFSSSMNLLFDINNYYDLKSEGRGGAIYVNPAFSYEASGDCPAVTTHMTSLEISKCNFTSNKAYDGFAIYIEGDDAETIFTINNNIFKDNYNESSHKDDKNVIIGAVIATEICRLSKEKLEEDNIFSYTQEGLEVKTVSCVDHYGNVPTNNFTHSGVFSSSKEFSPSKLSNPSSTFNPTNDFSSSSSFTQSSTFSSSSSFTQSSKFSSSSSFTKSSKFSSSSSFTQSSTFSSSSSFTQSSTFSSSSSFTQSSKFSSSSSFTKSSTFSSSSSFTQSSTFSSSSSFTKSSTFSPSSTFTQSSKFSSSSSFTQSSTFSPSSTFTQSSKFSSSSSFTQSSTFSPSSTFTQSSKFSSSSSFTQSSTFSPSSTFTQSSKFSSSSIFSPTEKFTLTPAELSSNEEITSSSENEEAASSSNNEVVEPDSSNEVVAPDSSNEVVAPDSSNEVVVPDSSNEVVVPDSSNEVVVPDSSNEVVVPDSSNEVVVPDSSNEVVEPDSSNEVVVPDSSNEVVVPDSSNEVVVPDSSNEVVEPDSSNEVVVPDSSNEVVVPDSSNEVVAPDSSNEVVEPDSSNEVVVPDSSNEVVVPDSSNEVVVPDSSNEVVEPDSSNEVVVPDSSNEVVVPDSSNEVVVPDSSNEVVVPDSSNEVVVPDSSNEVVVPDSSNEVVVPDSSNEVVVPDSSNEVVVPDSSNEVVVPDSSNEVVVPDSSNEVVEPDSSNEVVDTASSKEEVQPGSSNELGDISEPETEEESTPSVPSEDPTNPLGSLCMAMLKGHNITINNRCDFSSDDTSSLVNVLRSNFTGFRNESHGGAIYVKNCGFLSKQTNFVECVSHNGGGGAICIKNPNHLDHNIVLEYLTFIRCSAAFGGACYLYSKAEENEVSILFCNFDGNIATKQKPPNDKDHFYGGSSIFISSKNTNVTKSRFHSGKGSGGAFKVYNRFDETPSNANTLDVNERHIYFDGCTFEHEDEAKSSIYYVIDDKSNIEITECSFKGKLSKGSHYVEGKMLSSQSPKLKIKLCSFEDENEHNSFVVKDQKIKDRKKQLEENILMANVLGIGVFILVIAFVCFIIKTFKSSSIKDNSYDLNDDSLNNLTCDSEL